MYLLISCVCPWNLAWLFTCLLHAFPRRLCSPYHLSELSQVKKQNESPKDEVKKAAAEDDEVDLSDSEYEEYSEYVTDSQVRIWLRFEMPLFLYQP